MCTHTVCVLARVFEEEGLTTVSMALVKEHAQKVKPPRALFVPFPYGYAFGNTNDPGFQHRVISAAFDLLHIDDVPVLAEFPEDAGAPVQLLQASEVQGATVLSVNGSAADEVTALRAFYERWIADHDGRTVVGLTKIPQRRFRGMIRFLESYTNGGDADFPDRPADIPLPQFLRYCVDDLKAFYYEARMSQRPGDGENDLHRWFWGETSAGKLIADLALRMNASDDPAVKGVAFGLAR